MMIENHSRKTLSSFLLVDSLLRPLLVALRQNGLPVSPEEYSQVIEALIDVDSPFSLQLSASPQLTDPIEALSERIHTVCRLLWPTTVQEMELFDRLFDQLVRSVFENKHEDTISKKHKIGSPSEDKKDPGNEDPENNEGDKNDEDEYGLSAQTSWWGRLSVSRPPAQDRQLQNSTRFSDEFNLHLPLTERQLVRPWILARRLHHFGPRTELDLMSTIEHRARTGYFTGPYLRSGLTNVLSLLLIIDYGGSMIPFRPLINALLGQLWVVQERFRQIKIYYFHDWPAPYLYQQIETEAYDIDRLLDPTLTNPTLPATAISELGADASVLVISDAGATKLYYEASRYQAIKRMIADLETGTPRLAWLNPLPIERWHRSTTTRIGELLPMYPLDEAGLNDMALRLSGNVRSR